MRCYILYVYIIYNTQGSVLGLVLFIIYVNNMMFNVLNVSDFIDPTEYSDIL